MTEELSKTYEPKITEQQANKIWLEGDYFHATPADGDKRPAYTIAIPPPNVTAPLHLGHALNNTLQDILIRYHRMRGFNTLWMPGTDHAGIATQTVVEKRILAEEGKRRTDFKREEFVGRVQAWKDEYEAKIIEQLKAMGCSCDWERTRFTMDEVCARAVRAAFFKLFKDGLIYRGKRLVNWDPATQTVLADDEVEHETIQGNFWYLRYPLVEAVEIPCGTGFQPVDEQVNKRNGAYLPHWTQSGAIYSVTFRLADSMPTEVCEQWQAEREKIIQNAASQGRELTAHEQQELDRLYSDKVESYLNAGHGQCYLREPKIAELAAGALKNFDGERYDLIAWAIMPNHVHAVVKPYEGIKLSDILHSWKSYTANKANELLGRTGTFWQSEYYDHLIRDETDLTSQVNYIKENPAKAGLENWPWADVKTGDVWKILGAQLRIQADTQARPGWPCHKDTAKMAVPQKIEYVTVATTRPETMLGDTAVAMNPADPRARCLVGKKVRLPIVGRIIPIIADEHVVLPNLEERGQDARDTDEKAKFSTGFLKVTPAHDLDDWAIGQRQGLEVINVLAPDGSISDKFGWTDWEKIRNPDVENLIGMDRFEAREAIVEWFREEGLLEEVRPYSHEVGHSYRSHVPIEPYLSDQWYIAVKKPITNLRLPIVDCRFETEKHDGVTYIKGTDVPVNSLAGLALGPLLDGRMRFIPERYAKTYQTWLENLRDWPISRQLWWGHRIPIWYCQKCGQINSGLEDPVRCEKCGSDNLVQDTDVLDTWFSSALWPFSTLGWPDETPLLKTFYPGDVLCTAREIITLWVSRMVMMGQYCVGDIPFKDVYIHAMIQDGVGRKMSKSLGNGIDPLVAINSHGADAMRFTLASMTTDTQDIRMPVEQMTLPDGRVENTSPKFDVGRNFCNKLWNASRFAMMNLEGVKPGRFDKTKLTITDKWILSRLARTIAEVAKGLDEFKYNEPLNAIYKFFWNDFCDWYLEWAKPRMSDTAQKPIAQNVLAFALDQVLRLLHPFVPFITEGIFQKLNEIVPVRGLKGMAEVKGAKALVAAGWPKQIDSLLDENAEQEIDEVQTVIRAIRDIRSKYGKGPSEKLVASVNAPAGIFDDLDANSGLIKQLAGLKEFGVTQSARKPKNAAATIAGQMQIYVHEAIDAEAERKRLVKQKEQVEQAKKGTESRLANENFITKAKPEVVAQAKAKLAELTEQLATIEKHLSELER